MSKKITGQKICEDFVKLMGLNITPEQFWELSPTGELSHVFTARGMLRAVGHPDYLDEEKQNES